MSETLVKEKLDLIIILRHAVLACDNDSERDRSAAIMRDLQALKEKYFL